MATRLPKATATPNIPSVPNMPATAPPKCPTAAALRKQEAEREKIALAAQLEHVQRAREQDMRASVSRPSTGLTNAEVDRLLAPGARRSTRAKVNNPKASEIVTSKVPKTPAARGARGSARGRGVGRGAAKGGSRGGKQPNGAKNSAQVQEPAAPREEIPLVSLGPQQRKRKLKFSTVHSIRV